MTLELLILSHAVEHARVCQESSCCLLRAIAEALKPTGQRAEEERQAVSTHRDHDDAWRLKEYIQAHCCESLTLKDISRAIGCHPRHAERCFKAYFNTSIRAYLQAARTAEALNLLSHTDLKIESVAVTVGFRSRSSLYRALDRLGLPPPGRNRKTLVESNVGDGGSQ